MGISSYEIVNSTYLQSADDKALLSVLEGFVNPHIQGLGFDNDMSLADRVYSLAIESREATNAGTCLPLYMPTGEIIEGSPVISVIPVWAGKRIEVSVGNRQIELALFDDHDLDLVPLIKRDDLFSFNAGFRTALLTHYVHHIAIMPEDPRLSSEAFVLGVYNELYPDDAHFAKTGLPSTCAASIRRKTRPVAPNELNDNQDGVRVENGWVIKLRDKMPSHKEFGKLYQATRALESNMKTFPSSYGGAFVAPTREIVEKPKKTRHGRDSTATMYQFVTEWSMTHNQLIWDDVLLAFENKYPQYRYWNIRDVEVNPDKEGGYRDSNALKHSFYSKKKREEKKHKNGGERR